MNQFSRRDLFTGGFLRGLSSEVFPSADKMTPARRPETFFLRPPGALLESAFLEKCTSCIDCIEACPHDSIRRLGHEFGELEGTPAILAGDNPCYLCHDFPCVAACEEGALIPVERHDVVMGIARIDLNECYQAQGQPCDYCVVRCPLKEEAIGWNDAGHPIINQDGCAGCGVCAFLCPTSAIEIIPDRTRSQSLSVSPPGKDRQWLCSVES